MPKADIDWDQVKRLCAIQCTRNEICAILDIHHTTLLDRCQKDNGITWKEFYEAARDGGKASIRRAQWQKGVEEKDTSMLRHLGKHYLDQHDRMDVGFDPDKPVIFELNMGKQIGKDEGHDEEED